MQLRAALPPLVCAVLSALLVASAVTCHTPAPAPRVSGDFPLEVPPQPVEHPRLQAMLPEQVGGYERTSVRAIRQPMGAFAMTQATATYGPPGGDGIVLQVSDAGGRDRLIDIGAVWVGREFGGEHAHGYERTARFLGYPAYERLDAGSGSVRAELQFVVAERFFVTASGVGMPMEALHEAVEALDFRSLALLSGPGGK
jgi:hypothetical protein